MILGSLQFAPQETRNKECESRTRPNCSQCIREDLCSSGSLSADDDDVAFTSYINVAS